MNTEWEETPMNGATKSNGAATEVPPSLEVWRDRLRTGTVGQGSAKRTIILPTVENAITMAISEDDRWKGAVASRRVSGSEIVTTRKLALARRRRASRW